MIDLLQERNSITGVGVPSKGFLFSFYRSIGLLFFICAFIHQFGGTNAFAGPVNVERAKKAAMGFFRPSAYSFSAVPTEQDIQIRTVLDKKSDPLFYVVSLEPSGFMILPADDRIEPVLSYSSVDFFDLSPENPLYALICRDLKGRMSRILEHSDLTSKGLDTQWTAAKTKWARLEDSGLLPPDKLLGLGPEIVSDIYVPPLILTRWDQSSVCGDYCYNYYTPNHYYAGCVATVIAQLLVYHQYPVLGIGQNPFEITVDGTLQQASTIGGDGSGGPYHWGDMVYSPSCGMTDSQRQAIGALCYDTGLSVNMKYSSSISATQTTRAKDALLETFGYGNAIKAIATESILPGFSEMVNPNLDAGFPVILGIFGDQDIGHAVLADGYGYNQGTLYHHLNMGWSGAYDLWYNLPNIDSNPAYTTVNHCIYNIFPAGSGEIVSGRVTDLDGAPVADVAIEAEANDGSTYSASTNDRGIYALVGVPSDTTYTVWAYKEGLYFLDQVAATLQSRDLQLPSGNVWACNFLAQAPRPPIAQDVKAVAQPFIRQAIILLAADEGNPEMPGKLKYVIMSLPVYGTLSDPKAGVIESDDLPYTLLEYGAQVNYYCYLSDTYEPDTFYFKANDGGTPPEGGDSNIAEAAIDIEPNELYTFEFDNGLPSGWTIVDGFSDGHTWELFTEDDPSGENVINSIMVNGQVAASLDEQLISGHLDCSQFERLSISFANMFAGFFDEMADVDIRVDQGPWQNIARFQGTFAPEFIDLDISSVADEQADVQFRWRYTKSALGFGWMLDHIQLSGFNKTSKAVLGDFEPDGDVDLDDFGLLALSWKTSIGEANFNPVCDISQPDDARIDILDLIAFSENWLNAGR